MLTRGPRATLDARRVGCLCVAIIFASDRTKTQIVIYPNNRIIVNIRISRYNGINTPSWRLHVESTQFQNVEVGTVKYRNQKNIVGQLSAGRKTMHGGVKLKRRVVQRPPSDLGQ